MTDSDQHSDPPTVAMDEERIREYALSLPIADLPELVRKLRPPVDGTADAYENERRPLALLLTYMHGADAVTVYPGALLVDWTAAEDHPERE